MQTLRAIETTYKGYRFRSRLEARWAVFFDALGIAWEYEKEGYDLGPAGKYLPDFWLPENECFVEVKGAPPTSEERGLAASLSSQSGAPVILVHGEVAAGLWQCYAHDIGHNGSGGTSLWEVFFFVCQCGSAKVSWGDGCHIVVNGDTWKSLERWCGWNESDQEDSCGSPFPAYLAISSTSRACNAARGARFEYGERPQLP